MIQEQTLAALPGPLLFLKALSRRRVFVPTFTKRDGTVIQGHYADVMVANDHNDERVLSGNGSHSQRQAHAKLIQKPEFHALPREHKVNLILHHATRIQEKASHASAISQWRAAALNGRNPSAAQWRAFYAASLERKTELLAEVERTGNTSHLNAPPMPAREAAAAHATAAAIENVAPTAPTHPVPRPAETLATVGLTAQTVEAGGHAVLADDSGRPRVFYHGGPAALGGGRLREGTFFSVDRAGAAEYAAQHDGGVVHEANLSLLKPASPADIVAAARAVGVDFSGVDAMDPRRPEDNAWSLVTESQVRDAPRVIAKLKEWGFDGAAFNNDFSASGNSHVKSVMVFSADQIVSPAPARTENASRVASAIQRRALERLASLPESHGEVGVSRIFPSSREVGPTNAPAANQWVEQDVDLSALHPMQDEVDRSTVQQYIGGGGRTPDAPIKVIRDEAGRLLVMDGHHRASAAILEGKSSIRALVATMTGVGEDDDGMPTALYATPSPAQPAAAAAADAGGPREGDTKTVGGVTYVLRDGRWHRQSPEAPAPAAAPSASSADRAQAAAAMGAVPAPIFHATSASNVGCTRRVAALKALALAGDVDGITNFATSRTRANYARVADYRDALLAAAQNLTPQQAQAAVSAPIPAAPTLTGANMQNTALLAAQRKVNMLRDAANAADPVAAIQAISTSRGNRYLNAADDYKRALLAHFGVNVAGDAVPGVTAETGVAPARRAPRVVAVRETTAAAPSPEVLTFADRRYRRGGTTGWEFDAGRHGWSPILDRSAHARLDRGEDPIPGGGSRADVNAGAGRAPAAPAPVPDSQNPAIAANPRGLSEEVLGFVPRPNVPLSVRTNQAGVQWPDPRMAELNRRYLAQSTTLQQRAREYQAGTYVPRTPEEAAAERAREAARARAEQEAIRRAAAELEARIGSVDELFRPRSPVGSNITATSVEGDDAAYRRFFGVSKEQAKGLFSAMVADYGGGVTFSMSASVSQSGAEVRFRGSDGTSITRQFSKSADGISVYHAYFSAGTTGGGSGKHLFRTSMGVYKALGVTEVGVTANIDVGGYAWARFGYLPRSWGALKRTIRSNLDALQSGQRTVSTRGQESRRSAPLAPEHARKIEQMLENTSAETLWAIADMKIGERSVGKELLLGTSWGGVMKLSHAPTMLRFAKYVKPGTEG